MPIIFSSVNNATGTGAELWQLVGGVAPAEIELNTTNGATGINAPLPSDNNFRFQLNDLFVGLGKGGGVIYEDVTYQIGVGVSEVAPGDISASFFIINKVTGAVASIGRANFSTVGFDFADDGGDKFAQRNTDPVSLTEEVADRNTGDGTQRNQSETSEAAQVLVAGGAVMERNMDASGFELGDGLAKLFKVRNTGEIETNQGEGATGLDTTILNRIPVYDELSVLIGYIPVMVDP